MRYLAKWCFAHRVIVVVTWLGVFAGAARACTGK